MTANAFELSQQVAVVTGSSSGIGRAIALELAAAGADILIHAGKSRQAAEQVAEQVRGLGRKAHVLLADLSTTTGQDELVAKAFKWHTQIDCWVNNAGADVLTGEPATWPFEKKLAHLWQVDVTATVRLSRAVGAIMKARGSGVILNVGWDQAERGMAGDSGELFATTKGAIMAFSRSLARTLAPQVRVNCLAPGWIKTSWGDHASNYWQQRASAESLLARWGTPEDVARTARFLASPAAGFITGLIAPVNGGLK